jgi:sulfur carrier protein
MPISILLNGEPEEAEVGESVRALLERLLPAGALRPGIAVAVNLEVVPKQELGNRWLKEGDRVEVLRAVGGG